MATSSSVESSTPGPSKLENRGSPSFVSFSESAETTEGTEFVDHTEASSSDSPAVLSLLSRLCQASKASVNRRRKVAQNIRHDAMKLIVKMYL